MDLLLIAGDLFEEETVSISDLKDLNEAFDRLTVTRVMIAAGNHDAMIDGRNPYHLVRWSDQVHIFGTAMEQVYLEHCNTLVRSHSWDRKTLPPLTSIEGVAESDKTNILMLHGDIYQENDYQYLDKGLLAGVGMDYVALGHIHKPDLITQSLAYPGSPEPLDFSETGQHGFIEGKVDSQGCSIRFIPFAKRSFRRLGIELDGTMTYEAICSHVSHKVDGLPLEDFYRIDLTGIIDPEVDLDLADIQQRLSEKLYYVEIKDSTTPNLDLTQLKKTYEGSLIGDYIEALEAKDLQDPVVSEALYTGLNLLLEGQVRR